MSQVTIYMPDDVLADVKKRAQAEHKSLSAYITALARRESRPARWPKSFLSILGSWEGQLERDELQFEKRQRLK